MIRKEVAAFGVGLAFAVSACGSPENATSPNDPVVERAFGEVHSFWTQRGIGGTALELVTLKANGDKFVCRLNSEPKHGRREVLTASKVGTIAQYCPGDNKVVVVDSAFKRNAKGASKHVDAKTFAQYIAAHEFGHHVTKLRGETPPLIMRDGQLRADDPTNEQRADCYAGEFLAAEYPEVVEPAVAMLKEWPESYTHGTGAARAEAILAGAAETNDGRVCGSYYNYG